MDEIKLSDSVSGFYQALTDRQRDLEEKLSNHFFEIKSLNKRIDALEYKCRAAAFAFDPEKKETSKKS